jgi:hypothetical protein
MERVATQQYEMPSHAEQGVGSSFSQYLSFRFYKDNLTHLTDITKGSINNFVKSISEIEEEFVAMIKSPSRIDLHDFGFNPDGVGYMEENY